MEGKSRWNRHQRYLLKKIKTEGRKLLCRSLHARQEILSVNNKNNPSCFRHTTTQRGFSNTKLCYCSSIKVLLGLIVTHPFSVTIADVTTVWSNGTQEMCSFTSKKVLLLSNTITTPMEHLLSVTMILFCNIFFRLL